MKDSTLSRILKKAEIAIRRSFIASLQFRNRSQKNAGNASLPLQLGEQPTIVFLRQDRLGDAIVSTPVMCALYHKYPHGRFIVVLGENNKGVAPLLPIPCEICIYLKKPIRDILMLRSLRKRRVDVLIDLIDNPSSTSSILTAAIAARFSVGIEKANSASYGITVPLLDRAKFHIARRLVELVRPFGIDPETVSLRPQLSAIGSEKKKGRIGLVLSAGAKSRYVTSPTNAEIASKIIQKGYANEVLLFFHPRDLQFAEEVKERAQSERVSLARVTQDFQDYAKELLTCEIIISPDTSAIHLCSAYGVPVLGLYAPFPAELHYWTPIGVPYEMIIQEPYLNLLESDTVIQRLEILMAKLKPEQSQGVLSS